MGTISITLGNEGVGSIAFTQPETNLNAIRTAGGFRVQVPATMTLEEPSGSGLPLELDQLRVAFFCDHADRQVDIGVARCESIFSTPIKDAPITFSWDWTISAFAFYEALRSGGEPKFRLQLCGTIRYILVPQGASRTGREACSLASRFYQWGEVGYSQRVWTKMMRDLNFRDSVLVEIPFASDPPTGWEPVWMALRDARDSFDSGGSTGWKGTATSVRLALEEWKKIEDVHKGPADIHQRTKSQRTDNVRWQLMQLAHFSAHTKADEWNRDDALLLLSSVCALLAVRKP